METRTTRKVMLLALCAVAVASWTAGCGADPARPLDSSFPAQAGTILNGGLAESVGGFAPARPAAADPISAAAASLGERGGLRLELPQAAAAPVVFALPNGLRVELRQHGASGPGRLARGAVAYAASGGTSYWSATAEGYEEWLLVENAGEGPVAEWTVSGGRLRQAGAAVELLDAAGTPRMRVTAPRAFEQGGAPKRAWLTVRGSVLALRTDARGRALIDPFWSTTGSMAVARNQLTATLLADGRVLVAGGHDGTGPLASAELFDPATGAWTATGSMAEARNLHTATLLPSGKVLVMGGDRRPLPALATAELYDPATGHWGPAATAHFGQSLHTATLLRSGKVLVVGRGADLYDPASDTWALAGTLNELRFGHSATLLPSGQVLVAGNYWTAVSGSAEIFDPTTSSWAVAASMATPRMLSTATLLPSGRVLVVGGQVGIGTPPAASGELFDPVSGTWSATGAMATARFSAAATLLPSGKVLATGGTSALGTVGTAELYDPSAGTWTPAFTQASTRTGHVATLLPSGAVLLAGGWRTAGIADGPTASAELYDPALPSWTLAATVGAIRYQTLTLLPSGLVLAAGGASSVSLRQAWLYDPALDTWTATGDMAKARHAHSASLLPSGAVLVTGGFDMTSYLSSAEIYQPATGTWRPCPPLAGARMQHTATQLPSGEILVVGGFSGAAPLATAERFDPATEAWSPVGPLAMGRFAQTATLLPTGQVLVAGGQSAIGTSTDSAELFDPGGGAWAAASPLLGPRSYQTATLLPSGRVLVAGGTDSDVSFGALGSAEIYDPVAGTWSPAGSMSEGRCFHTATLLASGRVLVTGGLSISYVQSAERYDPTTDHWSAAGFLSTFRESHAATLLPSGRVLVEGGVIATPDHPDLFDEGLGGLPASSPTLDGSIPAQVPGEALALSGARFTGVSEGSSGATNASSSGHPLVQLRGADSQATRWTPVSAFTSASATAVLPSSLWPGLYWVRVFVNGSASEARPLRVVSRLLVAPQGASVPPGGTLDLSASGGGGGGAGLGYAWTMPTNISGGRLLTMGSLDAIRYVAGRTGGVIDMIQVTDSLGLSGQSAVTVTPGVSVAPGSVTLPPRGTRQFTASGGSGTGYVWALPVNGSGGSLDAVTGAYLSGSAGGTTDTVQATDSLGNTATAIVTVGTAIPPLAAPAPGGCNCGHGGADLSLLSLGILALLRIRRRTSSNPETRP